MDFQQLKSDKFKKLGEIGRKDLADNLEQHLSGEINQFASETKLSLGQSLNLYSPKTEEKRPRDAILDCIAYRNLRVFEEDGIPASPVRDFFDKCDANFALGVGFLQNVFSRTVGFGIDKDANFAREYIDNAPNSRANMPRPFNPQQTGPLEKQRNLRPRLRLADVIAVRRTILGDQYEAPIVETPTDTKLRPIGENADVPRYKISLDDKITRTSEIGYELELSDKVRRSPRVTMDAITEIQADKARQTEIAIVNEFCNVVAGNSPTAFNAANGFPSKDIIKLHLTPKDEYVLTTFVGTLDACVDYMNSDIFFKSSNQIPGTPRQRNYIDLLLGNETIAVKSSDEVSNLGTGKKMIAWDRMTTVDYIVEQGGTISETYRENRERVTVISNLHAFASHLRAEASQCRYLITIAA